MAEPLRHTNRQNILVAKAANGVGTNVNVQDFKNIQLNVATSGGAALTLKIQGSLSEDAPDFSAAATSTNRWDFVACFNYIDPTTVIPGGTGIVFAANVVRNLLVNVDGIVWLNCQVSGYASGAVDVEQVSFNNQ